MSLQEALATGGETTALGLCIVFLVLIILMLVLKVMEKIFYKNAMKEYGEPAKVNDEYIKARIAELKPFYQYSEFNLNDMAFIEDYLK